VKKIVCRKLGVTIFGHFSIFGQKKIGCPFCPKFAVVIYNNIYVIYALFFCKTNTISIIYTLYYSIGLSLEFLQCNVSLKVA